MTSSADREFIELTREEALREAATEPREEVERILDESADGVPVRVYLPTGCRESIVYLHGGGFVFGELDTHDGQARLLANRTGRAVCSVAYRRAPEHPYPAAVEDALTASDWWASRQAWFGLDPARQAVCGDSAGGNLALVAVMRRPGRFARAALVYPFVDPGMDSYDRARANEDLTMEESAWYWLHYAPDQSRWGEPDLDPMLAAYENLPPTLIQLAQNDVLRAPGLLIGERLRAAGVPVDIREYPGVGHGFWRRLDNDQAAPALSDLAGWLAGRAEWS